MTQPLWSTILSEMIMDPAILAKHLDLDVTAMHAAHGTFPLRVPKRWLDKIPPGELNHPLLRQVLPLQQEVVHTPGYSTDPLQENQSNPAAGLLHKYPGRVLLITAPSCAIHCRYCFRRHFPYNDNQPSQTDWNKPLDYIRSDPSITEVILSGGDPLMLKNKTLEALLRKIDDIEHINTVRFHSRMPVVLPERIDSDFLSLCKSLRCNKVMVIHSNHALEIDKEVEKKLHELKETNMQLLNQSVLLAGVNDKLETLLTLSKRLWTCATLPYYLHMPDKVAGTAHFDVSLAKAKSLIEGMRQTLPGYLVPKLAQENPGESGKTIIA